MYNEGAKIQFLDQLTNNLKTRKVYIELFNAIEEIESRYDTDICAFNTEQLKLVTEKILGARVRNCYIKLYKLRQYARWYNMMGLCTSPPELLNIKLERNEKMRKSTVPNPLAMKKYLGEAFGDPEDTCRSMKNIYKCYLWLAYGGAYSDEALEITEEDIQAANNLEFVYRGHTIYLYKEALRVVDHCCGNAPFDHDHGFYNNKVPRAAGNELLRSKDGVPGENTIKVEVSRSAKNARDNGKTDTEITFSNARLSGRFYRIYEREMAGYDIDFYGLVETDYKFRKKAQEKLSRITSKEEMSKLRKDLKDKARDFENDYICWKLSHQLNVQGDGSIVLTNKGINDKIMSR